MKKALFVSLSLMFIVSCKPDLSTLKAQYSYSFGFLLGNKLRQEKTITIDKEKFLTGLTDANKGISKGVPKQEDKSYLIGNSIGSNFKSQEIDLDMPAFTLGIDEAYDEDEPSLEQEEMEKAVKAISKEIGDKNLKIGK